MRPLVGLLLFGAPVFSAQLAAQSVTPVVSSPTSPVIAATPAEVTKTTPETGTSVTVVIPVTPVVTPTEPPGNVRIVNLSTRARVTNARPLFSGFSIRGATSRTVLVRAAGPTLARFGLTEVAAAPRLRLHDSAGAVIFENAGWNNSSALAAAAVAAGAFPFVSGSADAALVRTLLPGKYSAEVITGTDGEGDVLLEIYDVDGLAEGSRLVNVSTLSNVPAGGEVLNGFVLAGTGRRSFLFRGVGPGLAKFGVGNTLTDPVLTLLDREGFSLASNDDWNNDGKPNVVAIVSAVQGGSAIVQNPVKTRAQAVGAFALDEGSTDAAFVTSLAPGSYTLRVRGVGIPEITTTPVSAPNGTATAVAVVSVKTLPAAEGVALLEIYDQP